MRILVVVHAFPPNAQGGAEIYADQHARALVRLGDTVHVLAREQDPGRAEYAVRTERRDGLDITWVNNTFRDVRTYEESYRCPAIARIAADLIDEFRPDVAHVHHLTCLSTEIPGLLAARGVSVLLTLHDYWLLCHRGQLLDTSYRACAGPEPSGCRSCLGLTAPPVPSALVPVLRSIEQRLPRTVASGARELATRLSHATSGSPEDPAARRRLEHMRGVSDKVTRFVAPSRSIRDRFISFGIAPERIEVSLCGFDRRAFSPHTASQTDLLRIGFLGTLMVSKAPHLLLEAFRRLPPGAATIDLLGGQADYHGDTSYREVLNPLLRLPGVRAHGPLSRPQVTEALASLDILVVPSIWPETSPLVIREAFLAGLPVVGSNTGGIPELIEHERNGLLFEPGSVDALERALRRLIDEPGLLDRLRTGAAATPVRTLEDDVAATRRLYESHVAASMERRSKRSRLAAVVLSFRTADDTAIAVASLMASDRPPDAVIVVDNDTGDECRKALARWNHAITYVQTGQNLGFSGGMNVGIRRALEDGADLVLLVNSDVLVPPDCLGRLETSLQRDRDVGIIGPLVLSRSSPDLVGSAGIDYNRHTGRMCHRGTGTTADAREGRADADVEAVSGCLMLVTRETFGRVGLLDERYFFGFEEIDLCLRAQRAGLRTRLTGRAIAYHEGARTIGAQSSRRWYFAARNHLLLTHTHANGDGRATRGARALFVAALNLAHAVKAPGGSLGARLGATLRGIRDHLGGRYGPDRIGAP